MADRVFVQSGTDLERALSDLGLNPVDLGVDTESGNDIGGTWIHTYHSSNVEALAYNPLLRRMLVAFRRKIDRPESSDRIYQYFDVDEELYDDLFSAGSPGGTVWERLRRAGVTYNRL